MVWVCCQPSEICRIFGPVLLGFSGCFMRAPVRFSLGFLPMAGLPVILRQNSLKSHSIEEFKLLWYNIENKLVLLNNYFVTLKVFCAFFASDFVFFEAQISASASQHLIAGGRCFGYMPPALEALLCFGGNDRFMFCDKSSQFVAEMLVELKNCDKNG